METRQRASKRSDEELLNNVAEGNSEVLVELFELYKTDVYRLALLILKDLQTAQDVTQEVFVKVKRHASEIRSENVKAWIMAITRNTAHNVFEKQKHEIVYENEFFYNIPDENYNSLEFYDLISALEEIDQEIITLYIVNGLKHKEIAGVVHLKESLVRKRYTRALKRLKNIITNSNEGSLCNE